MIMVLTRFLSPFCGSHSLSARWAKPEVRLLVIHISYFSSYLFLAWGDLIKIMEYSMGRITSAHLSQPCCSAPLLKSPSPYREITFFSIDNFSYKMIFFSLDNVFSLYNFFSQTTFLLTENFFTFLLSDNFFTHWITFYRLVRNSAFHAF